MAKLEQKPTKKIRTIADLDGFDSSEVKTEPVTIKQTKKEVINEIQRTPIPNTEIHNDLVINDALFISPKKDLKRFAGFTISESLIEQIENISKRNNISKSEVVDLILKDFFNRNKFN